MKISNLEINDKNFTCEIRSSIMHGVEKTFVLEGSYDHDNDIPVTNASADCDEIVVCKDNGYTDGVEIPWQSKAFFQVASPVVELLIGDAIIDQLTGVKP